MGDYPSRKISFAATKLLLVLQRQIIMCSQRLLFPVSKLEAYSQLSKERGSYSATAAGILYKNKVVATRCTFCICNSAFSVEEVYFAS